MTGCNRLLARRWRQGWRLYRAGWLRRADPVADRGSGTVLVLAVAALVLVMLGWMALLAQAQTARGTAQSAADLGALAGATATLGAGDGCAVAAQTIRRHGAEPHGCDLLDGGVVRVGAAVRVLTGLAVATARAGPRTAR